MSFAVKCMPIKWFRTNNPLNLSTKPGAFSFNHISQLIIGTV